MGLNDYELFYKIVRKSQPALMAMMKKYLLDRGYNIAAEDRKNYLFATGDIPILLVAHLDTVFPSPPQEIYYDNTKCVMWSPQGLGADDRAGVFAILKLLQRGYRPHILLTCDEEKGCLGVAQFVQNWPEPIEGLKYIIQVDRRGENDCVFYDCDNAEFTEYVEGFGFKEQIGSYSDISILCPQWGIAGVNLSVGYVDEHDFVERLHFNWLYDTINKINKMLIAVDAAPKFEYVENYARWWNAIKNGAVTYKCKHCKDNFLYEDVFAVQNCNQDTVYYCLECAIDNVEWCEECGHAFENIDPEQKKCFSCRGGHDEWKKIPLSKNLNE